MSRSKIVVGGETLIDLTKDTARKAQVLKGFTFHNYNGDVEEGTCDFDANTQDADLLPSEALKGRKYWRKGKQETGTLENRGSVTLEINTVDDELNIPIGIHDGGGVVKLSDEAKTSVRAEDIREGTVILGKTGTMKPTEGVNAQSKEIASFIGSKAQVVTPDEGYNYLTQVTVAPISIVETENESGGTTVTIG